MALLDIRQRTGYLFMAVTIGHIVLISAQVNTQRGVPVLETVTFGVFAEVQRVVSTVIGGVRTTWVDYFALQEVHRENERLQEEIAQLRVGLQQERALAQQSRELEALVELRTRTAVETTGAAVIAPEGVVGRIITPSARAAKVQLLIDRNAAAGALVERSRAQGVVEGTGRDLRLNFVSATADLQVGDVLVTSGIDGIYPKGFVIGQIESLERRGGEFADVVILPAVDFSSLEAVLVVLTPPLLAEDEAATAAAAQDRD